MCGYHTRQRKILYPNIFQASQYIDDNFWKEILISMSYGKCPQNCYIKNYALCYKHGTHFQKQDIPPDPIEIPYIIINFLHKVAGIVPRIEFECVTSSRSYEWDEFPKKGRYMLLTQFIRNLAEQYNLTPSEINEVRNILDYAFYTSQLKNRVHMGDGYIESIDGFYIERPQEDCKAQIRFDVDPKKIKKLKLREVDPDCLTYHYKAPFYDTWVKFIHSCVSNKKKGTQGKDISESISMMVAQKRGSESYETSRVSSEAF